MSGNRSCDKCFATRRNPMGRVRDLLPWISRGFSTPHVPPSRIELLTAEFYLWEQRGRGWEVYPSPVALEPPFLPFRYRSIPQFPTGFDDGRQHSLFSRLVDGVGN